MTGNIGRTGIVDEDNCYLNQRVLKLECMSKSYLLAYLIKHLFVREYILNYDIYYSLVPPFY